MASSTVLYVLFSPVPAQQNLILKFLCFDRNSPQTTENQLAENNALLPELRETQMRCRLSGRELTQPG